MPCLTLFSSLIIGHILLSTGVPLCNTLIWVATEN